MDIRSFFGGGKGAVKKTPAPEKEKDNKSKVAESTTSPAAAAEPTAEPIEEPVKEQVKESAVRVVAEVKKEDKDKVVAVANQNNDSQLSEKCEIAMPEEVAKYVSWKEGENVPYLALVDTFEKIASTSGRLEKESYFTNLYRAIISTTPTDLCSIVYLSSNSVAPAYEGLELGIGDSLLVKAICQATGRNKEGVEEDYKRLGDLGSVALISRSSQKTLSFGAKPQPLSANHVLEQLKKIAQTKGEKSTERKINFIKGMMIRCQGCEAKYLVRALQGKLRIGIAAQTVLVSIASAFILSPPKGFGHSQQSNASSFTIKSMFVNKSSASTGNVDEDSGNDEEYSENELVDSDDEEFGKKTQKKKKTKSSTPSKASGSSLSSSKESKECAMVVEEENSSDAVVVSSSSSFSSSSSSDSDMSAIRSDVVGFINSLEVKEPLEARRLRHCWNNSSKTVSKSLTKDEIHELAVIAVKRAFSECPNYALLCEALLNGPMYELYKVCQLLPGVPVAPMLAKPTKEVGEVLKRLSGLEFTMEYKYDGERAQVHILDNGTVKIFSRNSEDNSMKYPDLTEVVKGVRQPGIVSCVFDAEVVAFDREKNSLMSFQVLSTRKRKVEEGDAEQKVKVVLQAFDLLFLNGKSLLQETLKTRRQVLHSSFREEEGLFYYASGSDHLENGDTGPIEQFMGEACTAMCEGLMVKTLTSNASYEPSKRSLNWLKLKKDYINGMGVCDSVDLVVIGGYHGKGKRTNVYGAYLMACYDADSDELQSVCKVGTGFKDEELEKFTLQLNDHIIHKKPFNYNVGGPLEVDIVWFDGSVVWEVQAADLSLSSVHKGGLGKVDGGVGRGIGLRFPRFLRIREDKNSNSATLSDQIVDMYQGQTHINGGSSSAGAHANEDEEEEDFI